VVRPGARTLAPACYLASLESNPFGDDCGLEGEELVANHHLLGVLATDSEEWR
jgi:hypothetical protein